MLCLTLQGRCGLSVQDMRPLSSGILECITPEFAHSLTTTRVSGLKLGVSTGTRGVNHECVSVEFRPRAPPRALDTFVGIDKADRPITLTKEVSNWRLGKSGYCPKGWFPFTHSNRRLDYADYRLNATLLGIRPAGSRSHTGSVVLTNLGK